MKAKIFENATTKVVKSDAYNYIFRKDTGEFHRWGKTVDDDPTFSPFGPEILDLEISADGCSMGCPWCYKSNTPGTPTNMSLETFKTIIDKFPKTLTQIAFGITDLQTNPDFISMMEYCREIGVAPNFTMTGIDLTDELANRVSKLAGAIAISVYPHNPEVGLNTVKKLTDLGMDQVNIHAMVSQETLDFTYDLLEKRQNDPRLSKMNAIVFLGVKPKGRAQKRFNPLTQQQYADLVAYCMGHDIAFGFDSCSAPKFEAAVRAMDLPAEQQKRLLQVSESCESDLFSSYINVQGLWWHCSFSEESEGYQPVNVLDPEITRDNFLEKVWYSPAVVAFREKLLSTQVDGCRYCPTYPEINNG